MGLRGPAPKPTEQKLLEGTYRADRAPHNEPKPQVLIPECPEWVMGEGRKEYLRLADLLVNLRVLTEMDWIALAQYAHEFNCWLQAERRIRKEGTVIKNVQGNRCLNPRVTIANTHFKNMTKLGSEFGLTPASRSRIEAQPEDEKQTSLAEKLFAGVSHSE